MEIVVIIVRETMPLKVRYMITADKKLVVNLKLMILIQQKKLVLGQTLGVLPLE